MGRSSLDDIPYGKFLRGLYHIWRFYDLFRMNLLVFFDVLIPDFLVRDDILRL